MALLAAFRRFGHSLAQCGRKPCDVRAGDWEAYVVTVSARHACMIRCALSYLVRDGALPSGVLPLAYEPRVSRVAPPVSDSSRLLLAQYAEYLRACGMAETGVNRYPGGARRFLSWLEGTGRTDLRVVDEACLMEYLACFGGRLHRGAPLSVSTRVGVVVMLRKFFVFLYRTRRIHSDPAAHVDIPRQPRQLPRSVPEEWEMRALLRATGTDVQGLRDLALLELAYGSGLRNAEVRGLRMEDLQLSGRRLHVVGKGGKGAWVPLTESACRALAAYLSHGRPALVARNGSDVGLVLLSEQGRPLDPGNMGSIFRRLCRVAGLERRYTMHSLRHGCATHLVRNGADIRVVQQLLRHERLETTALYTRVVADDVRKALEKFHPRGGK